ncbi:MAG: unknown protein [Tomato bushy stunt virus satellite RNA C]|nr:MAG: unknown protein [Tomato bushy stunt virus satellite RNA C]
MYSLYLLYSCGKDLISGSNDAQLPGHRCLEQYLWGACSLRTNR